MKKVLYVSANGFIGGAEKFLLNIAHVHSETKDQVHFLLFDNGSLETELKALNVPVTVLKNKFRVRNIFKLISAISEIKIFLKNHNFNTIHSTMSYSHFVMGLATPFTKINRVWFQHGPVGGIFDYLASIFRVDILLFSSHFLMEKHYSSFFLRQAKHGRKVIPLPVEIKTPKLVETFALKKSLNIDGLYVIGMMGRIARGKGYEIGIKAFLELELEDSKLIIVGSPNREIDKIYFQELKEIVTKHSAEEKIIFIPHQSDISIYLKLMNLLINPVIIDEGFGLTVAEAMKAGVPVISSAYGGLSEFVKVNETAEVLNARNPDVVESLKELILRVKSDELYAKKLSKNAKELIENRFSLSQTYVAITDVYQFLDSIE